MTNAPMNNTIFILINQSVTRSGQVLSIYLKNQSEGFKIKGVLVQIRRNILLFVDTGNIFVYIKIFKL